MARDKTLSLEERTELSGAVKEAIFVEDYKSKLEEFNFYRQQDYMNWYTGITKADLPSNHNSIQRDLQFRKKGFKLFYGFSEALNN